MEGITTESLMKCHQQESAQGSPVEGDMSGFLCLLSVPAALPAQSSWKELFLFLGGSLSGVAIGVEWS